MPGLHAVSAWAEDYNDGKHTNNKQRNRHAHAAHVDRIASTFDNDRPQNSDRRQYTDRRKNDVPTQRHLIHGPSVGKPEADESYKKKSHIHQRGNKKYWGRIGDALRQKSRRTVEWGSSVKKKHDYKGGQRDPHKDDYGPVDKAAMILAGPQ